MRSRILLASASPRRRELLRAAGLRFDAVPVEVDESLTSFTDPSEAALALARRKALAGARRELAREPDCSALVIGADTIVAALDGGRWCLLGKPADAGGARAMLTRLSGSRHAVVTGVCVARCPDLALFEDLERTWVRMRVLSEEDVEGYVRSGEWRDKAGGYAIQESADRFVTELEEGGVDNVVGLPVKRTMELIERAGGG